MSDYKEKEWYKRSKEKRKERYANDPEFRKKENEYHRNWKRMAMQNPRKRAEEKRKRREYYMKNRERLLEKSRRQYARKKENKS